MENDAALLLRMHGNHELSLLVGIRTAELGFQGGCSDCPGVSSAALVSWSIGSLVVSQVSPWSMDSVLKREARMDTSAILAVGVTTDAVLFFAGCELLVGLGDAITSAAAIRRFYVLGEE